MEEEEGTSEPGLELTKPGFSYIGTEELRSSEGFGRLLEVGCGGASCVGSEGDGTEAEEAEPTWLRGSLGGDFESREIESEMDFT